MDSVHYQSLSFQLEGQFLGFINKPNGQLKSLRLMLNDQELHIKLDKELRGSLGYGLAVGDWIQVVGKQKFKGSFNDFKLKAFQVNRLSYSLDRSPSCPKKGKILLCNKSDCAKNGSEELYQALQKTICRLGLEDSVTIQKTSCQKRCKKAPNIILMPGKEKCSNPRPQNIANLLRDHYLAPMD
ncbi:MAG: (2Fe-2S) ferredoxin domain-containing protein [cyanobacterium endosymbiont of Rhopalodia musculus]|uniref:(2Fe-2S) ferredoxin domain-containing protein n=1 Tax=cyanobacterium endosymbiont of Epithemia clementina EcSB TaxID=3034674 RepID=UPI002480D2F3|nr:(2Fe-2S) ferredoxin domain-containing protein [cyanobacterium endosymbiont of Epithemia clementina EcSB]WGT67076.1 (2Fe-2S) ferredoxin domain-containing protein [cyanobacterium endosymbiont of Epithemia clementina EcSB]